MRARARLPQWLATWPAGLTAAAVALASLTLVLHTVLGTRHIVDVTLLFLLLTLLVSAGWGFRVGIPTAIAANLIVNFFFVPPLYTFTVQQLGNTVALLLFLAVSSVGASMLSLLRRQVQIAQARQAETAVFLGLSQALAQASSPGDGLNRLCVAASRALAATTCAILRKTGGEWQLLASSGFSPVLTRDEVSLLDGALSSGVVRRPGKREHEDVTYVPFSGGSTEPGVLRIGGRLRPPPLVHVGRLLEAFADEASVAVHRALLAQEAAHAESLRRADELKSALLSSVSHDLRSPLTAIKAAVGSLRDQSIAWTEGDEQAFLATIESQTDRLTATVTSLLQMSRLEGGATRPSLEPIEAAPLLEEIRSGLALETAGRDVCVEAPDRCWVRADYALLSQALTNLVQNAAHYSTPGGRITLCAVPLGHSVAIHVRDVGPGIAPDDLPHIFEKFYRGAQSSAVNAVKGTGLGLSIVKAMVELCGGTISVDSTGEGTTFTITLPTAVAPA